ncbi:hypothetical protein M514_18888, partial [Trichuris suis]
YAISVSNRPKGTIKTGAVFEILQFAGARNFCGMNISGMLFQKKRHKRPELTQTPAWQPFKPENTRSVL